MIDGPKRRMRAEVLWNLFNELLITKAPAREGAICALPIPGYESHRLGRTQDGAVCLAIETSGTGAARPDVRLENLRVQRRVVCEIVRPCGDRESLLGTVITCRAESLDLKRFFLELFEQALQSIGQSPPEQEVDRWIDHATRLFAELETTSAREIQGLWGELLVISEADDPSTLVRRWHEAPEDQFDFFADSFALEVKTCRDLERIHHFSLGQLRPPAAIEVLVASVHVQADAHGTSVVDLMSEIESRINDPELKDKLRRTAFRVGGRALAQAPQRFDRRAAAKSVRLIRSRSIPAIEESPPPEVLHVQITVRCRDIPGEDLRDYVVACLRG